NNDDGFVDMLAEMTVVEKEEWAVAVMPLRNALVKTRRVFFKVINSPTILLPSWCKAVAGSAFCDRTLPRDVSTCWNLTYNMLAAFIEMKEYIDIFLDSSSNGLTQYLLMDTEWKAVEDLVHALKV
ncbi:hypothetical protein BT96DRAFT_781138, partial [Gymnopus androsaceus JB14]